MFVATIENDGSRRVPFEGWDINHAYSVEFFSVVIDESPARQFFVTSPDPVAALSGLAVLISGKILTISEKKWTRGNGKNGEYERTLVRTTIDIPELTYGTTV